MVAISVAVSGGKNAASPATSHTPAAHAPATRTPSPPPALSSGEQKFVTAIRSALAKGGYSSTGTDAQLASVGDQICKIRQDGGAQADVIGTIAATGPVAKFSMTAGQLVRAAERDICPAEYPQPPVVLLKMSGNGIENSAPFLVTSGTLTVTYSYDCSSFGGSGNFIADLESGNQASLDSDDQSIANALGSGGSATTTIYPQDVGSDYYLAVNSECSWSVEVTDAG